MPSLDELFQGFKMLDQGVTGLALHDAMSKANDQVAAIRNSQASEEEKIGGLRNLATDFTLKLTGMGIEPGKISEATKSIAPPLENLKTPEDAALMGRAFGFPSIAKRGEDLIKQKQQFELQKVREASKLKVENKYQDNLSKELDGFGKAIKPYEEMMNAGRQIQGLTDPSQAQNFLTQNMGMIAAIRAETNRVTNLEFQKAIPNQSIAAKAQRAWDQLVENKPLQADQEALQGLSQFFKYYGKKMIAGKANAWAKNRAGRVGLAAPEFAQKLQAEHLFDDPEFAGNMAGMPGATAQPGAAQPPQAAPTSGLPGFTPYNK